MENQTHPYEERFVAFIDILGFSSLLERAALEAGVLEHLVSTLREVRNYASFGQSMDQCTNNDPDGFFRNMFRMTTFSDSMVISSKNNLIGLGLIIVVSAVICNRLLHQGIFTRGAISRGKLIHTEEIVLGGGLVEAYSLESSTAIYPRIILADCLKDNLRELVGQRGAPDLRRQDFDGLWHIHVFHPKLLDFNWAPPNSLYGSLRDDYMVIGRSEIERELRMNRNPAVRAKLGWLARYFNEYASDFGLPKIPISDEDVLCA